ncbi:MAG: hypothetical protein ACHQAY_11110 [Hyphomicrobiales bacterium]
MSNEVVNKALWWLCLVIAPAVLAGVELFHPAGFTREPGMFQFLSQPMPSDSHHMALAYSGPQWWFVLHMIQTPMVGLVSVGLCLLVGRVRETDAAVAVALAWLSRAATLVFLLYYTALDSIGGTGLGRLILNTQALADSGQLTPEQVEGISRLLNVNWTDPWVGGVGSFISQTGSWAVFASALFAAAALLLARRAPWPPLIVLVGFGWELQTSHASPHGPIAFGLLIVAALWLWFADFRTAEQTGTE